MGNYSTDVNDANTGQILILLEGELRVQLSNKVQELNAMSCLYLDESFQSIEALNNHNKLLLIESHSVKIAEECDELTMALVHEDFFSAEKSAEYRNAAANYLKNRLILELDPSNDVGSLIDQICDFIKAHLDEKLSVEMLMDEFSLSRMKLIRLFQKNELGSVMAYVKKLRLDKAKELLEESELNINQIAAACGFADTASFSHFIKKNLGKSPSQIRSEKQWLI